MTEKRLVLALGDRYGVGPALVARLAAELPVPDGLRIVVAGDPAVFDNARRVTGVTAALPEIGSLAETAAAPAGICFLPLPYDAEVLPMGRVSTDAGRETLAALDALVDAALAGEIHGIVYGPLSKQAMMAAGHAAGDELDFLAARLPAGGLTGEVNILGSLWTSRVTSHVPLRDVGPLITPERVEAGIELITTALRNSGRPAPRIAMAALNPHAGEGGAYGTEEIEIIAPAIAAARRRGHDVAGPFPADTVFPRALDGGFDGVVTMFHDQGQIALKLLGLGRGVTLLAGFGLPIATPGHGTAYDIAGTGRVRIDGMRAATELVMQMMRA